MTPQNKGQWIELALPLGSEVIYSTWKRGHVAQDPRA